MAFFRWFYDDGDPLNPADIESRWRPDCVAVQDSAMVGTAGEFHGYEGLAAVNAEIQESFEIVNWNPVELTELDDGRFLVRLEPTARSHHGVELSFEAGGGWLGHLVTLHDDGRAVRLETYLDEGKAKKAAGLA